MGLVLMVMLMMLVIKLMIMLMVMMLVIKLTIMLMVMMDCGGGRTNQLDYLESLIGRHQAGSQIHQEERVVLEEHNAFSTQTIRDVAPPKNRKMWEFFPSRGKNYGLFCILGP